VTQNQIFIL